MARERSDEAMSHAQPEPKSAPGVAAEANCSLKPSKEPKAESMESAFGSPAGSPPPSGPKIR